MCEHHYCSTKLQSCLIFGILIICVYFCTSLCCNIMRNIILQPNYCVLSFLEYWSAVIIFCVARLPHTLITLNVYSHPTHIYHMIYAFTKSQKSNFDQKYIFFLVSGSRLFCLSDISAFSNSNTLQFGQIYFVQKYIFFLVSGRLL